MTSLHLVRLGIRRDKLVELSRRWHLPLRDLDVGYASHCLMRDLWQDDAPQPFRLKETRGAFLEVWGYSQKPDAALMEHLALYSAPDLKAAIDDKGIASRPVPEVPAGKAVGFELRACPIIRQKSPENPNRTREIDAWLAEAHRRGPDAAVTREEVYRAWLHQQLAGHEGGAGHAGLGGAELKAWRLAGFKRERVFRKKTAAGADGLRHGHTSERPDVTMEGVLEVKDAAKFQALLARGIGRHRAFGFGMLVLVPPRMPC